MDETTKPTVQVTRKTKNGQNRHGQPTTMIVETTIKTWVEAHRARKDQQLFFSQLFLLFSVPFAFFGFAGFAVDMPLF